MFFRSLYNRKVSLDATTVRSLVPSGHVVVIPAPRKGYAIQVVSASFQLHAGDVAYGFTNDMVLSAGHLQRPQFGFEAAVINSSFDEWVGMLPLERGDLRAGEALTFGPSAGANIAFEAYGGVVLDITYRLVKA